MKKYEDLPLKTKMIILAVATITGLAITSVVIAASFVAGASMPINVKNVVMACKWMYFGIDN